MPIWVKSILIYLEFQLNELFLFRGFSYALKSFNDYQILLLNILSCIEF